MLPSVSCFVYLRFLFLEDVFRVFFILMLKDGNDNDDNDNCRR